MRGNAADEVADFADFIHRGRQAFDRLGDGLRLVGRLRCNVRRIRDAGRNVLDRLGDFLGGRCHDADVGRRLL